MTASELIAALDLPAACRVGHRVPKTLLVEHGAPTAADRRLIQRGIEACHWVAVLKPTTIGVAAYEDAERRYLEIAVLQLTLRPGAKAPRLVELVHRAISYPVVLLTQQQEDSSLTLAHKRHALSEGDKIVLDGDIVSVDWAAGMVEPHQVVFREALAVGALPRTHLRALYQGFIDSAVALCAAAVTGVFSPAINADHAAERREALRRVNQLDAEIARLRSVASRATQIARRVDLNLKLKEAMATRALVVSSL